jgi:putative ATP-dependent endonuclease of OLD family
LDDEFSNIKKAAFVFRATKDEDGKIVKNLGFFYTNDGENWFIGSMAGSLRNQFLQSAIIPAFRDTKDQLRINQWSWYGKLLKHYIDAENIELKQAFDKVKDASQKVFANLQEKVCDKKTNIAFPGTTITFQFNPDTKQDIYKNALIYVDDGFNSELQDKGSGIQSAVTISLFDFFVREVAHTSGSLLAIEEPELYLHPHGRRVISDRLNHFLDGGKNQVVVTTHSTEFIVPVSEELNIICVHKKEGGTTAKNTDFNDPKRKQILIRKQHAEMFFADYVILTEDAKYFLEEIAKGISEVNEDWLNENNVSILNVGG